MVVLILDSFTLSRTTAPHPMTPQELDEWSTWALSQADRIDPVASGAFRTRPDEGPL
jgi:hypothetical protein